MNAQGHIDEVLSASPREVDAGTKSTARVLIALGVIGAAIGFFAGDASSGWVAVHVATALAAGLAVSGVVLSAIFEMTGAKWGRAYRRLAEGSVVLMPVALLGAVVIIAGAGGYIPWLHHGGHRLVGGKAVWLTRGFWSLRVLGALAVAYTVSIRFVYWSVRRDFCVEGVAALFKGFIAGYASKGIADPSAEAARCSARLATLAPAVAISFALCFTLLGFDLIMALEPPWTSTLFGAWYSIGHLFAGLALVAVVSLVLKRRLPLGPYLTEPRQRDLATLLFAFTLVNIDFFWSQYLTIWYGNLPEETAYVLERVRDPDLPWAHVSWAAICGFFFIPFVALIFRRVKRSAALLGAVALAVVAGVFLARFVEIAPSILHLAKGWGVGEMIRPMAVTLLVIGGFAGAGWEWYWSFLTQVPIMPVGDAVFTDRIGERGHG